MLGLDDSDRETIPDYMMGELSDQAMMMTAADGLMASTMGIGEDGGEGDEAMMMKEPSSKTDLDYYILGAFSALNVSNLPLPIQVGTVVLTALLDLI